MRIGIIGAGMIGSTLTKLWVDAGHEVRTTSRHPEQLQPIWVIVGALGRGKEFEPDTAAYNTGMSG